MSEEQSRDVPLVDGNDASIQSEHDEDHGSELSSAASRRLFSHCMDRETSSDASLPYLSEVNGTKLKAWFLHPQILIVGLVVRRSDGQ